MNSALFEALQVERVVMFVLFFLFGSDIGFADGAWGAADDSVPEDLEVAALRVVGE